MEYPTEFSPQARAAVEAELIQAWRRHVSTEQGKSNWRMHDAPCIRACIMSVFLTYAREVIKLGRQKIWAVDKVRAKALEGLCSITIEVASRAGAFQSWAGWKYLDPNVQRDFEKMHEWWQFEEEMLALATSVGRAPSGAPEAGGVKAEPPPEPRTETRKRRREILRRYRTAKSLATMPDLARHLGMSVTAIQGIVRDDGTRYGQQTLADFLKKIGVKPGEW